MSTLILKSAQRGVTLVELMIGMLIGMLAVLLISQVLLTSETQKRTSTGGSDAQVNAALALYSIQRDVQMAGYGIISSPAAIGCTISARYNGAVPTQFPTTLAPVFITAGGSGAAGDSIRMLASSKATYAIPTRVIAPVYAVGNTEFNVRASLGFAQGDLALVAVDTTQPCWVFQVTGVPTPRLLPRANNATWNPANAPDTPYGDGSVLMNLGTLVDNLYSVNGGVLQISSFDAANPGTRIVRDVQSDIVMLRAFYGRDTSGDGIVDVYDNNTPAANDNAAWLRVLSVRVIVVARSSTWERKETRSDGTDVYVTPANPRWSVGTTPSVAGAATCAAGACLILDVGADAAGDVEAKHHRYKVFDTVIPLRNMMWKNPA